MLSIDFMLRDLGSERFRFSDSRETIYSQE